MAARISVVAAGAAALAWLGLGGARPAAAEPLDVMNKRLGNFDAEVRQLVSGIRRPNELGGGTGESHDVATRRTIDAQVNFGVGNYDDAAIVLYDVVERYPNHKIYDEALYYLAESLFMKGDYVASRTYFTKLVSDRGPTSRFYQQGLERLIELTLKLNDAENIDKWLSLLDAVPAAERRSSVPYVRGKYAFFSEKYDDALARFGEVAKGSQYYLQARYFIGAAHIAKKDLASATTEYEALVRYPAKTPDERRVVELSQIALGRIHYERNQPSKAIDRYLEVSRRSDLFDETMYEASWVYVKNKEFEKALRALELLALSDVAPTRVPEVRILEGNLRIRKAQRLGDDNATKASEEEYQRAVVTFQDLRKSFAASHEELARVVADKQDPRNYLAQVTGRHAETFDIKATLPEMAAAFLREEPEVKRIVVVEGDLGMVEGDIEIAEQTIDRLEHALSSSSRVNIFPALAEKRIRGIEIQDDISMMRVDMAKQLRALLERRVGDGERAELARLAAVRDEILREMASLPDANRKEGERVSLARGRATAIERQAAEVATGLSDAEAKLVALETYLANEGYKQVQPEDMARFKGDMEQSRAEIEGLKGELGEVRRDLLMAQDLAGTGDEASMRRNELRQRLRAALDEELRAHQGMLGRLSGDERARADQLVAASRKGESLQVRIDNAIRKIDGIVEGSLAEITAILTDEKAKLAAYKQEYTNYDEESHGLGSNILGDAFATVVKKLYNVVLRSDVGVVDVAWSMKEGSDRLHRRLTLDQARETRTLDTEFSDVITEIREQRERERQEAEKAVAPGQAEGGAP